MGLIRRDGLSQILPFCNHRWNTLFYILFVQTVAHSSYGFILQELGHLLGRPSWTTQLLYTSLTGQPNPILPEQVCPRSPSHPLLSTCTLYVHPPAAPWWILITFSVLCYG